MFIDLDRFKLVNDSLGHDVGDRLLQHRCAQPALPARSRFGSTPVDDGRPFTLSRLGGDRFTVILEGVGSAEDRRTGGAPHPRRAGHAVRGGLGGTGGLGRHRHLAVPDRRRRPGHTGAPPTWPCTVPEITRSRHHSFFSDDLNAAAVGPAFSLEGSLRHALERQEFRLHYQPKADPSRPARSPGVEALLRWHRPGHGVVIARPFHLGAGRHRHDPLPVGAWVIRTACAQLAAWDQQGLLPLRMAVNLSARQFRHLHLARLVETRCETRIKTRRLEIRRPIAADGDSEATRNLLAGFARMGVRLAIDDFGTRALVAQLPQAPEHRHAEDRPLVRAVAAHDAGDVAIATAVIAMGRSLQLNLVAEGVETPQQAEPALPGLPRDARLAAGPGDAGTSSPSSNRD